MPAPLIRLHVCFQNDYILGPTDLHGQGQQLGGVLIHPIELPHPAKVARGEAGSIGETAVQVFGCGHSRAFLRPGADDAAQFAAEFHLGQLSVQRGVQGCKHGGIIDIFADVHGFSFPAEPALFRNRPKRSTGGASCVSLWPVHTTCTICSQSRTKRSSMILLSW